MNSRAWTGSSASLRSNSPTGSSVPCVSSGRRAKVPLATSSAAAPKGVNQTASVSHTTSRVSATSSVSSRRAKGSFSPQAERKLSVVWRGIVPSR